MKNRRFLQAGERLGASCIRSAEQSTVP